MQRAVVEEMANRPLKFASGKEDVPMEKPASEGGEFQQQLKWGI